MEFNSGFKGLRVKPILLPAAIVDEMELLSISSTIAAGYWFDDT